MNIFTQTILKRDVFNQSINIFILDNKVHNYITMRERQTETKKTNYTEINTMTA